MPPLSVQPGTSIGAYLIERLLGAGGMGEVYRARDTKLGRPVALKILPTHLVGDAERQSRFEREANLGGWRLLRGSTSRPDGAVRRQCDVVANGTPVTGRPGGIDLR